MDPKQIEEEMAWSQSHYDTAIAMGLPANTASFIASCTTQVVCIEEQPPRHVEAYGTSGPEPTRAQAPPKARDPIQAPEAVSLRPETQTVLVTDLGVTCWD